MERRAATVSSEHARRPTAPAASVRLRSSWRGMRPLASAVAALIVLVIAAVRLGGAIDPPSPAERTYALTDFGPAGLDVTQLVMWDGRAVAMGARTLVIDPDAALATRLELPDGARPIAVASLGERSLALVGGAPPRLVELLPGKGLDRVRTLRTLVLGSQDTEAALRLTAGAGQLLVWGSEATHHFRDGRWHTIADAPLSDGDARRGRDQPLLLASGVLVSHEGEHDMDSVYAYPPPSPVDRGWSGCIPPRDLGSRVTGFVATSSGQVWATRVEKKTNTNTLATYEDGAWRAVLRSDAHSTTAEDGAASIHLLGGDRFQSVALDREGRLLVVLERQGIVRREHDGAWRWLTPSWLPRFGAAKVLDTGKELLISAREAGLVLADVDTGALRPVRIRYYVE